jgi:hypothetical protein
MKKRAPKGAANSDPSDTLKKAVPIDNVFTESTVTSGGIIITGEHVAKLWEESRKPAK